MLNVTGRLDLILGGITMMTMHKCRLFKLKTEHLPKCDPGFKLFGTVQILGMYELSFDSCYGLTLVSLVRVLVDTVPTSASAVPEPALDGAVAAFFQPVRNKWM
jgi:hypothetical protein